MAKLYFTYAAMNAGKSTALLQSAFNYQERGMRTVLYTAANDERSGKGVIASRIGLKSEAFIFDTDTDIFTEISAEQKKSPIACVFVDEAQFLKQAHVRQLSKVVDQLNIPVMCYGLRTDFLGSLFEGSEWLFAFADTVKEMKSICFCGKKATMNLRINADGEAITHGNRIDVGGNEKYVPLCRKHFTEKIG